MQIKLRRTPAVLCAAVGALALAGTATAQPEERHDGHKVIATLTGTAPVPEPSDSKGAGLFEARVDPADGRICYTLTTGNVEEATGAHLYKGAPGEAGAPVLTLETPEGQDADAENCQDVDPALAQAIIADPDSYYVTVATAESPNGAIRGQLSG